MTGRRCVVMAVAGLLAVSMPASAQWWATPKIYCAPGAPKAYCFGAYFEFAPNPDPFGGTLFSAFIQNLQGSFTHATTPTAIRQVSIGYQNQHPSTGATHGFVAAGYSSVTPVGDVEEGQGFTTLQIESSIWPFMDVIAVDYIGFEWNAFQGIAGCNGTSQPTGPEPSDPRFPNYFWRTCPREGLDGWMRMDFFVYMYNYATGVKNPLTTLNDFGFSLTVNPYGGPWPSNGAFPKCNFGNPGTGVRYERGTDCNVFEYHLPTVTPEPSTLLLLGGTLPLALGFVRARRKRR